MKTKEYVQKFTKETSRGVIFDNKGFVKALIEEFEARLEMTKLARLNKGQAFEFNIFQNLVKEMEDKFWAISSKKPGVGFTPGLWNAFYATGIIPIRAKYFPKEHAEIDARRQRHLVDAEPKISEMHASEDWGW